MTTITVEIDTFLEDPLDDEIYKIKTQRIEIDLGEDTTEVIDGEYIKYSARSKEIVNQLRNIFNHPGHLGVVADIEIVAVNGEQAFYCPL